MENRTKCLVKGNNLFIFPFCDFPPQLLPAGHVQQNHLCAAT